MSSYAGLQECRQQMTTQAITDNSFVASLIEVGSNAINEYCGQNFDEQINQLGFSGEVGSQNPTLYLQDRPLLSALAVYNGNNTDGSNAIVTPGNYQVLPLSPYTYPKTDIRMTTGNFWTSPFSNPQAATCWPPFSPLPDRAYAIDAVMVYGLWGFHRSYPNAWVNTGYTLNGAHTNSIQSITLTQAQPLANLDVGNVVRITSSTANTPQEYFLITGPVANSTPTGMTTNVLTVQRGYNNSTPQAYNGGEAIYIWRPETTIRKVAAMMVAWLYETRLDATGNSFSITELGTVSISVDLPPRIKRLLAQPFYNWRYGKG